MSLDHEKTLSKFFLTVSLSWRSKNFDKLQTTFYNDNTRSPTQGVNDMCIGLVNISAKLKPHEKML